MEHDIQYRLIRALRRESVDMTPIWLMRQAGRYLPEYRSLRERAGGFIALCKNPELACKITLQPVRRFKLDAAIIFSDILTIPDAMGLGLYFSEKNGPMFKQSIRNEYDINQLPQIDPEIELDYVMKSIRLVKKELDGKLPLIGFAGSPWTVATYMIEGGSSKNFSQIKRMIYQSPEILHILLTLLSDNTLRYLKAQISAGVDVIMLFDTWGGVLTAPHFQTFSLDYMVKIVTSLKAFTHNIPIILFTKDGGRFIRDIMASGCDAIGLDWTVDFRHAKKIVGNGVALQGNLDTCVLYGTDEQIIRAVKSILTDFGPGPGHIFNLGHGIHPDVSPERVEFLIETVKKQSFRLFEQSVGVS